MGKLAAAVMLWLPVVANGELIQLRYEGTVESIFACGCESPYSAGDPIGGVLTIDTAFAPPDGRPDDPRRGEYFLQAPGVSPDFVSDRSRPHPASGGRITDMVTVLNDWHDVTFPPPNEPSWDTYEVIEGWHGVVGDNSLSDVLSIGVNRFSNFGQLVDDDGLVQRIDVTPSEGTHLYGSLQRAINNGLHTLTVNFNLTRISLTPGSCGR